ncbi:MAG TPA: YlxR family protein [Gaiellales bacterium]|nr:YlxR family protein [Gaiellales bacterium]
MRQCAGCGARRPQAELVRLRAVDGTLVIDRDRRSGGRGAYLCPSRACAGAARRRGALARRLRCALTVPADLGDRIALERPPAAWKN